MSRETVEGGLHHVQDSPRDRGRIEAIVRRPASDERELLEEGQLDKVQGLMGDNWFTRGSSRTADGSAHPRMQLTLISTRFVELIAGTRDRWWLAGDQLYVDFDLSEENLPAGSLVNVGAAIIEVSEVPHTGCGKFADRYGIDAMKVANSALGRSLRLRGMNAVVVQGGTIRIGDTLTRGEHPGGSSR